MANIPTNPLISATANLDLSIVESVTAFPDPPIVTSNSHVIQTRADQALWDVTASAYVAIQNTSVGTTSVPKNGQ